MINDFIDKIISEEDVESDSLDDSIKPSDISLPELLDTRGFSAILKVSEPIGELIYQTAKYSMEYCVSNKSDTWAAMPYNDNTLELPFHDIEAPLMLVNPPCAGIYVCLPSATLEKLAEYFPAKK